VKVAQVGWPGTRVTAALNDERRRLAHSYPSLSLTVRPRGYVVDGAVKLQLEAAVVEGQVPLLALDLSYDVAILLSRDHPRHVPLLICRDPAIPRLLDRHLNERGFACLCARSELRSYYPCGSSLVDFLDRLVVPFLVGQHHYTHTGRWPGAERSHSAKGILEAYSELLDTVEPAVVCQYLRQRLRRKPPAGHVPCPCGSRRKLRHCHRETVGKLWAAIDRETAELDLADLEVAFMKTRPRGKTNVSKPNLLKRYGLQNGLEVNR
jgi:hypothetical protein